MDGVWDSSVKRVKAGKNIGFLFEEEDKFNGIGYKVAQAPDKECFLKGAKIRYNGQLKLIYFVEDYQNLPTILSFLQINAVSALLCRLVATILQIPQYGFLNYENILISPEDIYFDPKTYEPKLVYLPFQLEAEKEEQMSFENKFRRNLYNMIKDDNRIELIQLADIIVDTSGGLEGLLKNLQRVGNGNILTKPGVTNSLNAANPTGVKLCCKHPEYPLNFEIKKEKFTFGRSKSNDGVLGVSNMISRVHFSIVNTNGNIYLVDEKSTKGTYLNGRVCQANANVPLQDGDEIRVWELTFTVKFIY